MKRLLSAVAIPVLCSCALTVAVSCAAHGATSPAATHPATTAATQPAGKPALLAAIRIGYDTTRITKPLKPDGTPDYVAALNETYSKGVTKDNNAAVLLLEAVGPDDPRPVSLPAEVEYEAAQRAYRQQVIKLLNIEFKPGQRFLDLARMDRHKLDKAMIAPWSAPDSPELAKWLDDNKEQFALVVAATKRPRYFMPQICDANSWLPVMDTWPLKASQWLSNSLRARANLSLQEGRIEDAWADLLAVHRLGSLLDQDPRLIAKLVGIAVGTLADRGTQQLAGLGKLTSLQARKMMDDLAAVNDMPDVVESINFESRFELLALATYLAATPPQQWDVAVGAMFPDGEEPPGFDVVKLASRIDPNVVLANINKHYDDLIAAMRIKDRAKREEAVARLQSDTAWMKKYDTSFPDDSASTEEVSNWASQMLLSSLGPTYLKAQTLAERAHAMRQLTLISLALAAYHADQQKYPAKLADLSPKYIKAVPTDLFAGGKEFVYKVTKDGYVLYSVGENGKDDGGLDYSSGKEGADDLVVRVPAVEKQIPRPKSQ